MSEKWRVRVLRGCAGFWVINGIFLVVVAFHPVQLPFEPSLFGLGIALFALSLMHWDKAESLRPSRNS